MSWFCKHEWVLLDKHEFESELSDLTKNGYKLTGQHFSSNSRTKIVYLVQCKKCGKLKKYSEASC